ncbi:MAG TPA: hypothetical protein VFN94_06090 [Nitrospiria bacterium]|nr:hypothetical protein [Nitrospiria bacterium]
MTVVDLIRRFREIPPDLHHEPVLEEFAATFGELLKIANKPSACTTNYDAGHLAYMKLIAPMGIYGFRLCSREDCLQQLQMLIRQYQADPAGFRAGLVSKDAVATGDRRNERS